MPEHWISYRSTFMKILDNGYTWNTLLKELF
jgi:hypothetical protein